MKKDREDKPETGSNGVVSVVDNPNPLQKLIQGFCSPQKMTTAPTLNDDEDDPSDKYLPDLYPKNVGKENLDANPVQNKDDVVIENATEKIPVKSEAEQENRLEEDVAGKVIAERRKSIEYFIIACILVLATLLSLKKLGLKTPYVDFSIGSEGSDL